MSVEIHGNHAFLSGAGAIVTFTKPSYAAFSETTQAAMPKVTALNTRLGIAPWGEDNLFPQNIVKQLDYCGVAKSALDWKSRALFGNGIVWGKPETDADGKEIFRVAKKGDYPDVDAWMRTNKKLLRFYLEFSQDWNWFGNCFPELILSKDGKKITKLVHQESCDCRFLQMDKKGRIQWVLLSKLWGNLTDQFVKFDPKKAPTTTSTGGPTSATVIDNEYVVKRRALDPYNPFEDLQEAVKEGARNVILPVQYPSPNKTYYQLAYWDGARMAGWIEIAAKIPTMLKAMYENAFNLKYQIEIPEQYMERRFGAGWNDLEPQEKEEKRMDVLRLMDKWLSGAENSYKTFVTYFDTTREGTEFNRIKINPIENKTTFDKDLLASATANGEILFAMQIKPNLIGASSPGSNSTGQDGSGSATREDFLVYLAQLFLERNIILEPLALVQEYNGWDQELEFRFRDIVLTTTDQNSGTVKKIS